MNVKKSSLFKNIYNTKEKKINPKTSLINKFKLTITPQNNILFYKLFNTDGYNLKDKNDEYYFDFDGDKKNFKNIDLVVFDVDDKNDLTIKMFNDIDIEINDAQIEDAVIIDDKYIEELVTSSITAKNILNENDIINISSVKYRFLFTNKNKNILYYFATNDNAKIDIIKSKLEKAFGVNSIIFIIKEKISGGKRLLKKY
jgi:hypothetical protein